jgi:myo-inositol-1(or 4)-monophosphatase
MVSMIDQNVRALVRQEINKVLDKTGLNLNERRKSDGSWVTDVDHRLTEAVEAVLSKTHPGITIVSEEGSHEISYPCFVLDPVDGTAGLLRGTGECSLSLAFLASDSVDDSLSSGYIAHLFSDFEVHSDMNLPAKKAAPLTGLVSRSEWNSGLFSGGQLHVEPLGSIALKLAYMIYGKTSFITTLRPKSLWDIAAGTVMLNKQQRYMWHQGEKIQKFDRLVWNGPTLWSALEEHETILQEIK